MEIRQLQIFKALAEELHFTRAAERVHCVQSNVTTQIRALEEELGSRLFDRLSKRVVLTDAGRRFLPYAERVLSTIAEARAITAADGMSGLLRIGSFEEMLIYRLPRVISLFRRRYPKVELSLRPDYSERLMRFVESGELDLGICVGEKACEERLKWQPLRTEKMLFIAHPKHPLVARKKLRPQDLSGRTLLVTEPGCAYRKKLDRLLAHMNVRPTNTIQFSSVQAIKECVSLGMGVALLPQIVVADQLVRKRLKVLHWVGQQTDIATYIVWHRDKWISPAMEAFIGVLEERIYKPPSKDRGP